MAVSKWGKQAKLKWNRRDLDLVGLGIWYTTSPSPTLWAITSRLFCIFIMVHWIPCKQIARLTKTSPLALGVLVNQSYMYMYCTVHIFWMRKTTRALLVSVTICARPCKWVQIRSQTHIKRADYPRKLTRHRQKECVVPGEEVTFAH